MTTKKITSTLVVMALNEEHSMRVIMPKIDKKWINRILVCDGNSTDGTVEYAKSQGYDVFVQSEKGFRAGYIEAFKTIDTDIVITFSPDGNAPPEDIPRLIEKMHEGYDMVIASRYKDDAVSTDDSIVSHIANKIFTTSINILYRGQYTDTMTIFRAYKTKIFYDLALNKDDPFAIYEKIFVGGKKISIEPILSVRALRSGLKIGEISSDEPARIEGESKVPKVRWGLAYYSQVLFDRFKKY
jgi:glycosyltransferase involved in cell wall biosynthesis